MMKLAIEVSAARSHDCQRACCEVPGGSLGRDAGVHPSERRTRSASKKLRNSDATSRSWKKERRRSQKSI